MKRLELVLSLTALAVAIVTALAVSQNARLFDRQPEETLTPATINENGRPRYRITIEEVPGDS